MARRRFRARAGLIAVIALMLAAAGVAGWFFSVHWRPSTDDFPVQGVEISEANGTVDWQGIRAAGADFGYARATVGATARDRQFERNWAAMASADIRRGALHVFSLCQLAADQAGLFSSTVARSHDALPAALELDFQPDCAARPERAVVLGEVATFITQTEAHTGKPVILKISPAFERQYRISSAFGRSLWAEGQFFPPEYLARPWRVWQASAMRRIDGADGPVKWQVVAR